MAYSPPRGTKENEMNRTFSEIASYVAHQSGRPLTFLLAVSIILSWALTGPIFHYSDTWQLIINTGITIVTFLMVFVIQNTQNRDGAALQAKLDELIRTSHAHNRFIGIEHLTDEEIEEHRQSCAALAKKATDRAVARQNRSSAPRNRQ
jgi:low affinity Fe/Cu permease